jgi:hypothetical protein
MYYRAITMIKPQYVGLGLLCAGALATFAPASATCVVADVAIQAAIHGGPPAEQVNDVAIDTDGSCRGNTSVNTSRQVQVGGTGEVRQTRQSRHQIRGGGGAVGAGPTVAVPVEVQVDVYNPADRLRR